SLVLQLRTQGFHFHISISLDTACIHFEVFKFLGALVLQFIFKRFKFLLNDLLHLGQMLGRHLVAGIEDLLVSQLKDNDLLGMFAHFALQKFFKFLAFFDDGVKFLSNDFVVILLKGGAFLIDASQSMIAVGLDLCDLGINACSLLAFSDRDLIFNTLESFGTGLFVYIGNDVLCK